MKIIINTNESTLPTMQLVRQIKEGVFGGELYPGSPLPSVRQLANDLEIDREAVAQAYYVLEHDSIIQMQKNRGVINCLQGVTRHEADELVLKYGVADESFRQDGNAMRFGLTLGNDLLLLIVYNQKTKEKSYSVLSPNNH